MRLPRGRGRGRGAGRGGGIPRMPLLAPRHHNMMTPELPLPPFGIPRGPMRMRPGPRYPEEFPRRGGFPGGRMGMGHPELPPRYLPPHPGFHPGDRLPPMPRPPLGMRSPPSLGLASRLPPAFHHMAAPSRPPFMGRGRGRGSRGRGGRGRGVKRLATSPNGGAKKSQKKKNKMRTAESESDKPWINEALKQEIVKKYELYATAKEKMTENSDWQAWKDQRILVGKMIHAAKLEYIGLHPEVLFWLFWPKEPSEIESQIETIKQNGQVAVEIGKDPEQVMLGQAPKTTATT